MVTKLLSWRQKNLSTIGRIVLIKVAAATIPSYVLQTTLLPTKICDTLDSMARQFCWGNKDNDRRLHLKAWDVICTPKCSSGLGIRRFRDTNIAYVTKLEWRVCTNLTRI